MGEYKRKFGSKAWAIIMFIIAAILLIWLATGFSLLYKNGGILGIVVMFGGGLFCIYKGLRDWSDKIIISNGELVHKKTFENKIIRLKDVKKIGEASGTHEYGRRDQAMGIKPLGMAYALVFLGENKLLGGIKEIRSYINYEELYKELESLTKVKIDREWKEWEHEQKS